MKRTLHLERLIERIEGEAKLTYRFKEGRIERVSIGFAHSRGMEKILQGRTPTDALVITPRVCGICNHAHLLASATAIEQGWRSAGLRVDITTKAQRLRHITLSLELIQNHIKWFYLTFIPKLRMLCDTFQSKADWKIAQVFIRDTTQCIALFAGQWPHSSYIIPGGVTCDPTPLEVNRALRLVESLIRYFEHNLIGINLDQFFEIDRIGQLPLLGAEVGAAIKALEQHDLASKGKSRDRFIVLGENLIAPVGKSIATTVAPIDIRYVQTISTKPHQADTVVYKKRTYEVGPLARAMLSKNRLILSLHKRYKDALIVRFMARIVEIASLLYSANQALKTLPLDEPSCCIDPLKAPENFSASSAVEAARGSLMHQLEVKEGKISRYNIITPTQWNLAPALKGESAIAELAMIGESDTEVAEFIFRMFDVCAVCTMK